MGYYSSLDYRYTKDLVMDQEKLKEVEKVFSEDFMNDDVYGFMNVKFRYKEGKPPVFSIILDEYYGKFYNDEYFAKELSKAVAQGIIQLTFAGEDGGLWGYIIKPNEVQGLTPILITDEVFKQIKPCLPETKTLINGSDIDLGYEFCFFK